MESQVKARRFIKSDVYNDIIEGSPKQKFSVQRAKDAWKEYFVDIDELMKLYDNDMFGEGARIKKCHNFLYKYGQLYRYHPEESDGDSLKRVIDFEKRAKQFAADESVDSFLNSFFSPDYLIEEIEEKLELKSEELMKEYINSEESTEVEKFIYVLAKRSGEYKDTYELDARILLDLPYGDKYNAKFNILGQLNEQFYTFCEDKKAKNIIVNNKIMVFSRAKILEEDKAFVVFEYFKEGTEFVGLGVNEFLVSDSNFKTLFYPIGSEFKPPISFKDEVQTLNNAIVFETVHKDVSIRFSMPITTGKFLGFVIYN